MLSERLLGDVPRTPMVTNEQSGGRRSVTRVLLLHGGEVPHYRVPVYNFLADYLSEHCFPLTVASDGIQPGNRAPVRFEHIERPLSVTNALRILAQGRFQVVIMFVNMRYRYLFPVYLLAKGALRCKMIWWGQGRDLLDPDARLKNAAYSTEHALCDAIILYAEHLKKYIAPRFHHKVFIANNTLAMNYHGLRGTTKADVLRRYNITTPKNIICVGRFQRRKRIDHLAAALKLMDRADIGLILVGPDTDGVLGKLDAPNIYRLGEMYGDDRFELMSSADVYCLPGAVGLSIVDAFHCGLPFVTEEGDESAEIAYLRHGENGFVVPRGDTWALARTLLRLLDDDELRARVSAAARREALTNARIERMAEGFIEALRYVTGADEPAVRHRKLERR